jgi:hypothetical protein
MSPASPLMSEPSYRFAGHLFRRGTVVAVYYRSGKVYQRPCFTQPSVPNAVLVRARSLL